MLGYRIGEFFRDNKVAVLVLFIVGMFVVLMFNAFITVVGLSVPLWLIPVGSVGYFLLSGGV